MSSLVYLDSDSITKLFEATLLALTSVGDAATKATLMPRSRFHPIRSAASVSSGV